jgi:hypothetical protein
MAKRKYPKKFRMKGEKVTTATARRPSPEPTELWHQFLGRNSVEFTHGAIDAQHGKLLITHTLKREPEGPFITQAPPPWNAPRSPEAE